MDLVKRHVVAVSGGTGGGPRPLAGEERTEDIESIHFHEKVMTTVQIRLGQTNSHGQHGLAIQAFLPCPVGWYNIATLVEDVVSTRWDCQHARHKCMQQ